MTSTVGRAERTHVLLGVEWGIAQTNHGRRGGVQRMHPGDGFVYYSPKTSHPDGDPLREFTAIGRVADGDAYQAEEKDLSRRMKTMRRTVAENDVAHWASAFLADLSEARPQHAKQVRPARRS